MEASLVTAFWVVSFSLVMVPGADWAYVISAGLRGRVVAPAVGGMLLGYLAITIVVAAGIGKLVATVPSVLTVLTIVGGAYLLWLGIRTLMRPPELTAGQDEIQKGPWSWSMRGFAISGLNPKALLLFIALLPQFVRPQAGWSASGQIVALGLVHMVNVGAVYSVVGLGSKAVLSTRPKAARMVGQLSGAAMILVAALLFAEQVYAFAR
ncbi:MAG: LysE family translocator [Paraburkholderia sp.]|uniref:LysE family translocator n=1 Tax=Paraburkholderia sp. TaxID=1926495 RepID=UPI0011FC3331|nr:LysE family translocator [Paraburkholderia sp.]TAM00779.1 MAG: LysE family translocator [Paraburkholderia sp.]